MEEGEEDEEEVTTYVHTFLDEEDEIHKSKKANVSRANHQASSVKTSSAKASSITVFTYTAIAWEEEEVTTYIRTFSGEGPGVWKCPGAPHKAFFDYIHTYIHT